MIDFSTSFISSAPSPPSGVSSSSTRSPEKQNSQTDAADTPRSDARTSKAANIEQTEDLDLAEIEAIAKLKQRDREVKAHEQAHISAGGQYVRSGAQYTYQKGPDGNRYAVGGEVQIDTSAIPGDPEGTVAKMQIVRRAALAPASPSGQDRSVASAASRIENKMRIEIIAARYKEAASAGIEKAQSRSSEHEETGNQSRPASTGDIIDTIG